MLRSAGASTTARPLHLEFASDESLSGARAGSLHEYLQILLPGIVAQTIVFITVYSGVGLNPGIDKGLFDRFRSLPIWQPAPIVGALLGDVLHYSLAALVVDVVGVVLGFRPAAGVVGVVLGVALNLVFAFALSWIWIIFGMNAIRVERKSFRKVEKRDKFCFIRRKAFETRYKLVFPAAFCRAQWFAG